MTTLVVVLLSWAGVLAVLVTALALATRHRREPREDVKVRSATVDRRRAEGDRRVGLPDLRPDPVERRSGLDRRSGARDRRRVLGPA